MRSDQQGRPPGVHANGVTVDFDEVERLRTLAESTVSTNSISIGAIHVGPRVYSPTDGSDGEPVDDAMRLEWLRSIGAVAPDPKALKPVKIDWSILVPAVEFPGTKQDGRPYEAIGDVLAQQVMQALRAHGPYCCSIGNELEMGEPDDVLVYRVSESHYVIMGPNDLEDVLVRGEYLVSRM